MTRLENQLLEATTRLNNLIAFSTEMTARLELDKVAITRILKKYGVTELNFDNSFVDFSHFDDSMIFRVYLNSSQLAEVSERKKQNISSSFKELGIPVGSFGMARTQINFIYQTKK